jgi:hypothetical protein
MNQGRMWERRGGYERVEVRRGEVRKWTDVPLHAGQPTYYAHLLNIYTTKWEVLEGSTSRYNVQPSYT